MTAPSKLFNKDFILLWQGQFVSQLGNQAHAIAMMFWLKHATESATVMGTIMMASMLPGVLLGPIGGTLADRFSRKKIIVISDIVCGVSVLSLAVWFFIIPERTAFIISWMTMVAVISGIFSAVFRPAISAAIPDLVPRDKVAAANSFNQSSMQVSMLVGQGAGGVLFRLLGAPLLFLIDGITYLVSAGSEAFITIPQIMASREKGIKATLKQFRSDTIEGFSHIWTRPGMRNLFFTSTFLNFFISPFMVLLPFYIEDTLGATPDWYGYFLASMGIGTLAGFALAGAITVSGRTRSWLIIIMLILVGVLFGSLGLILIKFLALGVALVIGILIGYVNINIVTILQITTPSEIRGRIFGVLATITSGLIPVGIALTGVVTDLLDQNVMFIFAICGGMTALCTVIVSANGAFREYLAFETANEQQEKSGEIKGATDDLA